MNSRLLPGLVLMALIATSGVATAKKVTSADPSGDPGPPPSPPAATYCSETSAEDLSIYKTEDISPWAPDGLNVADITLGGKNSNDCYGVVEGNLPESSGFTFLQTNYTFAAKSGGASAGNNIDGIDFSVATTGDKSGDWILSWVDTELGIAPDLPAFFDLVIGLKAGNNYAAYLFDDVELITDISASGTFRISFNNFKGNTNSLSHLNVYAIFDHANPPADVPQPPPRPPQSVPEPGSLALMALGLIGLATARRRLR